jgi:hypothetical protein
MGRPIQFKIGIEKDKDRDRQTVTVLPWIRSTDPACNASIMRIRTDCENNTAKGAETPYGGNLGIRAIGDGDAALA